MQEQPQIKLLADQLAAKQREKTLSDEEIGRLFYAIMESGDTVSKRPLQASEQTAPGETKGENAEEKSVLSKLYDADLQRAAGAEQQGAPDIAEKSAPSGQDGTQDGATAETYAQMQEKTAVNTDPATHTQAEQAIIEEYQKSVDPDLVEYAEGVKNGAQVGKSYSFGSIPQRLQQDIRRLLQVDTFQYSNELTMDDTRHILKRHGENGVHDRSMRNLEDIGRISYVVENYDGIEKLPDITAAVSNADGTPAPMLKLRKKVNGTFYVVEAVPVSAAKRLRIISAYMDSAKKGQKLNQALNMKVTSPQPTSETLRGSVASAEPSIARGESGVKKNRSTKSDKTSVQKAVDALYEADTTRGEDAASLAALRKEVLDKTYQQLYNEKEIKWAERHGYTLLQESDYVKLSRESGWSPETVRWITTREQYELLRSAGLHEERICGRLCLVKDHIDVDYVFVTETGVRISNREQMQKGNSPRDAATGKPIELHHLGQDANSPFVELTPEEHRLSGNYSIWHANGKNSWRNKLNAEKGYNRERIKHWNERILETMSNLNPRVVIVTDRKELDKQIAKTFSHTRLAPARATSGKHLIELINSGKFDVITSIINKFNTVESCGLKNNSRDIFVLVDESHRSNYGSLAAKMRTVFPNACYIGFTGTPLMKNEKSTLARFGKLIHKYTIKDGVEDKAIVPLIYEGRFVEQNVDEENIDLWFSQVTKKLSDAQKADLRDKWSTIKRLGSTDARIKRIALDINQHFLEGYKNTWNLKENFAIKAKPIFWGILQE